MEHSVALVALRWLPPIQFLGLGDHSDNEDSKRRRQAEIEKASSGDPYPEAKRIKPTAHGDVTFAIGAGGVDTKSNIKREDESVDIVPFVVRKKHPLWNKYRRIPPSRNELLLPLLSLDQLDGCYWNEFALDVAITDRYL